MRIFCTQASTIAAVSATRIPMLVQLLYLRASFFPYKRARCYGVCGVLSSTGAYAPTGRSASSSVRHAYAPTDRSTKPCVCRRRPRSLAYQPPRLVTYSPTRKHTPILCTVRYWDSIWVLLRLFADACAVRCPVPRERMLQLSPR
eukprot:1000472-Rhodomonas_salina.3